MAVVWACDAVRETHVLAVLPNRLQATVQAFLETMPAVLKTTVRRVCIDMWQGCAGAVAAALPAAEVVVDRFPVAVQDYKAVDDLRQQECRRLNAGRPVDQALPIAELRSLLRREWSPLTPAQQDQLATRLGKLFTKLEVVQKSYFINSMSYQYFGQF